MSSASHVAYTGHTSSAAHAAHAGAACIANAASGKAPDSASDPVFQILDALVKAGMISPQLAKQLKAVIMAKMSGQPENSAGAANDQGQSQGAGGASPSSKQQMSRSLVDNAIQNMSHSKKKGSGSWFEALAEALGKALDAQAQKVQELGNQITDANGADKPSTMTKLQTESQRLSFMMNAVDQILKTIGEALATIAKKN